MHLAKQKRADIDQIRKMAYDLPQRNVMLTLKK